MKSVYRINLLVLLAVLIFINARGQNIPDSWSKWNYLIGEWVGDGKGEPGEARGWFSLKTDLDKNVLIRTNHAEYGASKDRPAAVHDDLMIIYDGIDGKTAKAIYFDNEKHVINYSVNYLEAESAIILTSEATERTPGFRFTYKKLNENKIKTIFEIASVAKPDSFMLYLEGTAHRKQ